MENYLLMDMVSYLLKKWRLILISCIIATCVLCGLKALSYFLTPKNIDFTVTAAIYVTNHETQIKEGAEIYPNYADIWLLDSPLSSLIAKIDSSYEMIVFDPDWPIMTKKQKTEWLRRKLWCTHIGNSANYDVGLSVSVVESDAAYARATVPLIMDDVIMHMTATTLNIHPDIISTPMETFESKSKNLSLLTMLVKYVILGMFLGAMFICVCLCTYFVFAKKVISSTWITEKYRLSQLEDGAAFATELTSYCIRTHQTIANSVFVLCSTLNKTDELKSCIENLAEFGYKVAVGFLQSSENESRLEIKENITTLQDDINLSNYFGHASGLVSELSSKYDYTFIFADAPNIDSYIAEFAGAGSCFIFEEAINETNKDELVSSIEKLKAYKDSCEICVAWLPKK